jgi:hypothetical protein
MKFALQKKCNGQNQFWTSKTAQTRLFLGSFDTNFCLLNAITIHLDAWMEDGGLQAILLFSDSRVVNNKEI